MKVQFFNVAVYKWICLCLLKVESKFSFVMFYSIDVLEFRQELVRDFGRNQNRQFVPPPLVYTKIHLYISPKRELYAQ